MYKSNKNSSTLIALLTIMTAGITYNGFGNNIETYVQSAVTIFMLILFFIHKKQYKKYNAEYEECKEYKEGLEAETAPKTDVADKKTKSTESLKNCITRYDTDARSQAVWQAFDGGKTVIHNSGDDYMTTIDLEGNEEKIKLKK